MSPHNMDLTDARLQSLNHDFILAGLLTSVVVLLPKHGYFSPYLIARKRWEF